MSFLSKTSPIKLNVLELGPHCVSDIGQRATLDSLEIVSSSEQTLKGVPEFQTVNKLEEHHVPLS